MYRNLLYRLLPRTQFSQECLQQVVECRKKLIDTQWTRRLATSSIFCKKRKSVEERAVENTGRQVIRYSPKAGSEVVGIWRNMTVKDLAGVLNKDVEHVYKALEFADKSGAQYRADTVLHDPHVVRDVVKISGARFRVVPTPDTGRDDDENKDAVPQPPAAEAALRPRPPVACIMGHVDHGKTTLLDALRDSALVDKEFGGITQHIGAFQVRVAGCASLVTFLDTPGHAAFSSMRARGALATDVVVLVVAADDAVMEQTVESIRMAREAQVPILVAVNKIDKPAANIDRTLRMLAQHGVVCEALGGEVQAVPISALKRTNLEQLVDALALQAAILDLKADPGGYVEGLVIEAQMDAKTGKSATVLVQRGTLRRGAVLVAGAAWAKVRLLVSAEGESVPAAGPGAPVSVLGWRDLPAAGDLVLEVPSEKRAHEVMRWRAAERMKQKQAQDEPAIANKEADHHRVYKEQMQRRRALGRMRLRPDGPREKMIQRDTHPALAVIVKGDVDGSVEAIVELIDTYDDHDRVKLHLVHAAVGPVTPGDLELAETFKCVVYAFNVSVPGGVAAEAKRRAVDVRQHNVIYRLIDDLKKEISARIPTTQEEQIIGSANVLQQFQVSEGRRRLAVAGCRCVKGLLQRDKLYRLVRDNAVLHEGKLASMKHLKCEVSTVKCDTECGLRFEDTAVQPRPGDTVVCFQRVDCAHHTNWDPGF